MRWWWCACLLAAGLASCAQAASVFDLMGEDPELSEFLDLVKTEELVSLIVQQAESTVFAPTNAAMRKYTGQRSANILRYHIVSLALSVDQLKSGRSVFTRLKGGQPVFVSAPRPGEVFINNARIITGDVQASSQAGEKQVLHTIDEVLEPTIPIVASHSMHFNPSAADLLTNSDQYDLGDATIQKFTETVQKEGKLDVFNSGSLHTFFIPIDAYFDAVRDRVTAQVIEGHVIPNHALFTRTMGDDSYRTLAFDEMLKVTIKLRGERLPAASNSSETTEAASPAAPENLQQADRLYEAQSIILQGPLGLQAGSALSKVVKPNMAVRNGVVHLIKKPLMVADGNVLQMIQEGQDDRFHEFYKLMQDHAQKFMLNVMTHHPYFTIFIPSNEAFYNVNQRRLQELVNSTTELEELLRLHVVSERVTTESVWKEAGAKPHEVESDAKPRSLYLSVAGGEDSLERTLTVEGGGTNATVIVADISRSNGVIHIIDRFLGIPYQTVAERLATDPAASVTSSLAAESGFTQQLKASDSMTLLLPADIAWQRLKAQLNTSYNAIFANKKSPEVLAVLQRHLVIGSALTIQEMANMTAEEGGVTTADDQMVKVELMPGSDTEYLLKWRSLQARVLRADEESTNGYIHLIDAVLIGAKDVSAPSTAAAAAAAAASATRPAAVSALLLLISACWTLLRL